MSAIPNSSDRVNTLTGTRAVQGSTSRLDHRVATFVVALVILASGLLAILALFAAMEWRVQPFPGLMVTRVLVVDGTKPIGWEWPGLAAGIQRGDHLIALDGQTLGDDPDAYQHLNALLSARSVGDEINLTFLRSSANLGELAPGIVCDAPMGGFASCNARISLIEFPDNDIIALFWVPFFAGVLALGISVIVLVLRHKYTSGRLVSLVSALLAIFCVGLFDINTTHRYTEVWIVGTALLGGAVVSLSLVFPARLPRVYRYPMLLHAPLLIALVPALIGLWLYLSPTDPTSVSVGSQLAVMAALSGAVVSTVFWIRQRRRAATSLMRDQANMVLTGFLFAVIPGIIWLINLIASATTGSPLIPFNTSVVAPFFALPTLSMAYAISQARPVDADRWISNGITYTFLALGLVLGYFLLVLSATLFTGRMVEANNPFILALAVFIVALIFLPVRTRLQKQIDKLYFRQRINYQDQVEQFARSLSALRELPAISAEYRTTIEQTIAPTHFFIFLPGPQFEEYIAFGKVRPDTDIRFAADSPLVDLLRRQDSVIYLGANTPWPEDLIAERARLNVLKPRLIVGFRGSSRLSGFAILGGPLSGASDYTFEEQRFVENLTNQMTIAVERAQVVDSLERRVRELGILSRVSQAVNFTGEFDQLLELIGTQTLRLIDGTHIYIALRDAALNELYYAFVQEDGERYIDKENRRWTLSSDVVSEVARTGQPLQVPSFSRAMSERGAAIQREDKAIQAWMGVPLIAGSRTLGVLSVGTIETNRQFSDEQMRMLSDIGSLAATSFDKARLFAETNLRARQLAALNDVSRVLVATELNLDLDKLLELITSSATKILNAEAGSLLLTVDDGSGDLEFQVDIGSPESDLVGMRVPYGRGLVGQVAQSGQVIIVNDAASDPRWTGELAAGEFVTQSVLAAPLITQKRTIGVLEILNRRDGVFTQEDADLLTTFAGQAAVAIENARLFQMTDQQLSERLTELEMLERIDAEMNRSHSLDAVAEIALRWAVANTQASAGVLGVVSSDKQFMRIVARAGYLDDEAPDGAQGDMWPLTNGIVSRSMRTRRAELVADVLIDPLYIPSRRDTRSQITLPMLTAGDVIALMILESAQDGGLRLAHMPFLQRLAEHASIAIANAQLYEELALANQSKSEFVSFVAHELKNPLTSIKGYADVIISGAVGALSDQQRNFVGTIRSNAERMNTLVSDLNDVTKLQTNNLRIEPEELAIADVIEETLRPLQKQIDDKGQRVRLALVDNLPLIYADRNRIIQVLTNLINNAHKYSPEDAQITIGAEVTTPQRTPQGKVSKPMLHVRVQDEGIGMDEDDLAKLFTPYFRSENPIAREQPGTGLGLTITRGIVERHEGHIWVDSTLGQGTTFHFTVPLAEAKTPEPEAEAE
ncbi:MAG: GAF domain-containing protein [Anaerolineae bacterium]|nr:GAF domain-containing protein [Anaerolineae bacterium]